MAALFTQAELESRLGGPRYLVQLTDDDGDGVADAVIVTQLLEEASRIAESLLWDGWPSTAAIAALAAADIAIRGAIVDIACGLAGDRRPEWRDGAGESFNSGRRARGEKYLREVATAQGRRSRGEATVGTNAVIGGRTTNAPPTFTFTPTTSNPKPGGF